MKNGEKRYIQLVIKRNKVNHELQNPSTICMEHNGKGFRSKRGVVDKLRGREGQKRGII
jgi:hypothetical protein